MGGTCNGSLWRDSLIEEFSNINFFNPVVPEWNEEAYKLELEMREKCDVCLYVITPKMTGVYSIAEATVDSVKQPQKTVFCFTDEPGIIGEPKQDEMFSLAQYKSLTAVGKLIRENGGTWCENLQQLKDLLQQYNG